LPAVRINARVGGGETALTHAAWFGRALTVARLLQAGADPNHVTDGGETALHYAIRRDRPEIVALLLNAGASRVAADRRGYTPLMVAAGLGRLAVTERLLELGTPATTRDRDKRTALLHAIRGDHPDVARLLITPATISQADEAGESAIFYAIRKDDLATLDALIDAGAGVNVRNKLGETPLMAAAFFGRMTFARRLLAAGARPGSRDEHDVYDAALIARTGGHDDIAELIDAPWYSRWFY
jgi:ankyrin repeat protein